MLCFFVAGFDLVYENGFVDMDPKHRGWSSYLGSGIDRGPKKTGKGRRQQTQPPENTKDDDKEKPRLAALDTYSKFLQTAAKGLK